MDDKVKKIVTAAVIQALGGEGNALVAEMTADVLNKRVSPYGNSWAGYGLFAPGYGEEEISYVESLAREHIRELIKATVKDWFEQRKAELRLQVIERIDAENIADTYMNALTRTFSEGLFTVSVGVEPREERDDD